MATLTVAAAQELVRKNLDEVVQNSSIMYPASSESQDDASIDTVIARTLPEAINAVNLVIPAERAVGEDFNTASARTVSIDTDSMVMTITLNNVPLRVLSFRASSSRIVIGEVTPEYSVLGREQQDEYVRGRIDAPVLVQASGNAKKFYYYTAGSSSDTIAEFRGVYPVEYSASATQYSILDGTYWAVINQLTGMVCEIYGEHDRAQYFFALATSQLQ